MDEAAFQRELVLLKHRVSQMASTFQRTPHAPRPLPAYQDAFFSNQLDDVKARLQTMQYSLDRMDYLRAQRDMQLDLVDQMQMQMHVQSPSFPQPPHNRLALPSGPHFWQLFTSLRTDMQGLNGRLTDLEQNVSDLEDRVEKLDPQLTPASSENNTFCTSSWNRYQSTSQWNLNESENASPASRDPHCTYLQHCLNQQDTATSNPSWATAELPSSSAGELGLGHPPTSPPPEGVAFRDKEIAQLEELMRNAQDSLKQNEDVLNRKDAEISALRSQHVCQNARIEELDRLTYERSDQVRCYNDILLERQQELESLREDQRVKEDHLNSWATKYAQKQLQIRHADKQVQQLKRALHDSQNSRQREIDNIVSARDHEIRKLREFCEAKESVVHRQDDIIARGATLMQEKDEELERLSHQMRVLTDDYRTETRERARFARLLDERDEEISQLKASLTHALTPKGEHGIRDAPHPALPQNPPRTATERSAASQAMQCSPFATLAAKHQSSIVKEKSWTPKAINTIRTPAEQWRASVWQEGQSAPDRYKFGVVTPPLQQQSNAPRHQRRDLRRSASVKLLQRLALAEEGESRPNVPSNDTKRTKLPLDDIDSRSPLQAPPLPRKMSSLIELANPSRYDGGDEVDQRQHVSRHQSMEELPRRRMQAYVEEADSSGERFGDA